MIGVLTALASLALAGAPASGAAIPQKPPAPYREVVPPTPHALEGGIAVVLASLINEMRIPSNGAHGAQFRCVLYGWKSACRRAKSGTFTVKADAISCSQSDIAVGTFSCDIRFTVHGRQDTRQVSGHLAFEFQEAIRAADIGSEGAAGQLMTAASDVTCTLDMKALLQRAGGGARCELVPVSGAGG